MNVTEQFARNVAEECSKDKSEYDTLVFIDPMTAIMAAKIIITLIGMFKKCRKSADEAANTAANPRRTEVAMVRKAVRKHLGFGSRLFKRRQTEELTTAVLAQSKNINVARMESLYREN
jgi:hypothetical protein